MDTLLSIDTSTVNQLKWPWHRASIRWLLLFT